MSRESSGAVRAIFIGRNGWRAGWRLLLFALIVGVAVVALALAVRWLLPRPSPVLGSILGELLSAVVILAASLIMARLERRTLAAYGLTWRWGSLRRFGAGLAAGLAALSILIGLLLAVGALRIVGISLAGAFRWAAVYAVLFLIVGFFEEFLVRGYALFTLTTGMGFWPSAVATSVLFGLTHLGNPGESPLGIVNAGLIGLVFCLMLRRTGDLWLAIGFHAAWDWAESWLYGVADSAVRLPGALIATAPAGPDRLSGGIVGPEGSVLCTVLVIGVGAVVAASMRKARYPLAALAPSVAGANAAS